MSFTKFIIYKPPPFAQYKCITMPRYSRIHNSEFHSSFVILVLFLILGLSIGLIVSSLLWRQSVNDVNSRMPVFVWNPFTLVSAEEGPLPVGRFICNQNPDIYTGGGGNCNMARFLKTPPDVFSGLSVGWQWTTTTISNITQVQFVFGGVIYYTNNTANDNGGNNPDIPFTFTTTVITVNNVIPTELIVPTNKGSQGIVSGISSMSDPSFSFPGVFVGIMSGTSLIIRASYPSTVPAPVEGGIPIGLFIPATSMFWVL